MKKIIFYLFAGIATTACNPDYTALVETSLPEPFSGKAYLKTFVPKMGWQCADSVTLTNDTAFSFKGEMIKAKQFVLETSPRKFHAEIILEPASKYKVLFDNENARIEVSEGGTEQQLMNTYNEQMKPFYDKEQELNQRMRTLSNSTPGYAEKNDSVIQALGQTFQAREDATKTFIKEHPGNYTSVLLAGNLLLYTFPELEEINNLLDTVTYSDEYELARFREKYQGAKSCWIQGEQAPDFITHNLNGKEVRLSDFKGKYVLLDFWASWCRPCRKRSAELKKIYPQLQERGIQVCGISMDEDKKQWETATREDGIVWTNTGDLKPFKENTIARDYKVNQLPTLFLINPDGVIAIQNPEIEDFMNLPLKNETPDKK